MSYVFLAGGILIMGLVVLQLVLWILEFFNRQKHERKNRDLATEILIQNLTSARQSRIAKEEMAQTWNGLRKFVVAKKVDEGGGITSFYLSPHDRKSIPGFYPGQYLTFEVSIPGHDKKAVRCYSLSDAPGKEHYRVSIKKILPVASDAQSKPGLVSSYFHDSVKEGDILDVKAPGGHFYLDSSKQTPIVLIGGGVGITPVLSMLNHVVENRSRLETWFFLGVRNGKEHVFKNHLQEIARANDRVHLNVCYSKPNSTDVLGKDYDHQGHVSVELFKKILPSNNYEFYICGPGTMMNTIFADLRDWGVPEKNIHFEAFGAASVKAKAATSEASTAPKGAPASKVLFSKSKKELDWFENSGSLLELAEAHGVTLPFGCRAGNCGTCLVALKEGEVAYIKDPGCDVETGACLSCISKPKGKQIVLDA